MKRLQYSIIILFTLMFSCKQSEQNNQDPIQFSGIYPHLASYNNESECGTGAIVSWADRLWVITYGPHLPFGSSDNLYEITPDLQQIVREESIGGTPANRMIHKESNQLFIGPYAIDGERNVRNIPYLSMPGRHTGNARHLTDPEGKIYFGTMEEGFYEVDVNTLQPTGLYKDRNWPKGDLRKTYNDLYPNTEFAELPGAHGKGLYSGQGVMVFSNNGESGPLALKQFDIEAGVLAEWDGNDWKVARRNQFVEVTGPGGIYGNENPETDPIWATGWDDKSVLLGVRNPETGWDFYRLPKASHSYDGAHGWNTEWPRIRDIGTAQNPDYLMTMHGMFWKFPASFTANNSGGVRPRSSYLKVIGDYTRWNDQIVFGCDDSAQKEFLNKRNVKGSLEGPGQSNSNLWFTSLEKPDQLGPTTAEGAVWISEEVKANVSSEPFLFAGWDTRSCWIHNEGEKTTFMFEIDKTGNGNWSELKSIEVDAGQSQLISFNANEVGEWVRINPSKNTSATAHFFYASVDDRGETPNPIFNGLSELSESNSNAGILWGLGDNRRTLGVVAGIVNDEGFNETGYYELDAEMSLIKKEDATTAEHISGKMRIPENVVTIDEASVLIIDDKGNRWRLPKGDEKYKTLTDNGVLRICREVATERDLLNCSGTFYELPAENADGYAKIRPVASHNFRIYDYASYRGMLILSGLNNNTNIENDHIIKSEDGKVSLWAGTIDDIWEMGKPVGEGGPWKNTLVKADTPSDPYLIGFYDKRNLKLSHSNSESVTFKIEVEPIGHGPWMTYKEVTVKAGETISFDFPTSFQSRWIRFKSDEACVATTWLVYN
ncbi:hypothetical protein ACFLRR_04395 [Bacteroidota bacterium]